MCFFLPQDIQIVENQTPHLRRIETQSLPYTGHQKTNAFQPCQSQTNPQQKDSATGLEILSTSIRRFLPR